MQVYDRALLDKEYLRVVIVGGLCVLFLGFFPSFLIFLVSLFPFSSFPTNSKRTGARKKYLGESLGEN
jgi:hypothetical protein